MNSIRDFFDSLFSHRRNSQRQAIPTPPMLRRVPRQETQRLYKRGDWIGGRYKVHGVLGKGGFGVVYLVGVVCADGTKEAWALKTFRDELLADAAARQTFKKEALLWVGLEEHPFILAAHVVDEVSGRLFVAMDYIAPDEQGRVSLADHLAVAPEPLDADRALHWAIQFCHGMEHANAHGIKCHRDIKPGNILITQGRTLKIADFGLAAGAEAALLGRSKSWVTTTEHGRVGLSRGRGPGQRGWCGTPGYIAPELARGEAPEVRSDIYAFGLVLWQMVSGCPVPPFFVPYQGDVNTQVQQIHERQMTGAVPLVSGALGPVIARCLAPHPADRYADFGELRGQLEELCQQHTGQSVEVPVQEKRTWIFWTNKGASLHALGEDKEAISCFDHALELDPGCAAAWSDKGVSLACLGRHQEALACYDRALEADAGLADPWTNKGISLASLGRLKEALACHEQALVIRPRCPEAWANRASILAELGRPDEAVACLNQALETNPDNSRMWGEKGAMLERLGQHEESLSCFERGLAINPLDDSLWGNRGAALYLLGRYEEALACWDRTEEIAPRNSVLWLNKGAVLSCLGRHRESLASYDRGLQIDSRDARLWLNKGLVLRELGETIEAEECFRRARELVGDKS